MATEIRVHHTKTEGKEPKYGYTILRDGAADPASAFKFKSAEEAEEAGLKEANKAEG